MERKCRECFWFRGEDYDFRQNFCMPRLDDNRLDSGYWLRYCKHLNEKGDCRFYTNINEYGLPGRVYRFFSIHSFKITVSILILILVVFGITKLTGG